MIDQFVYIMYYCHILTAYDSALISKIFVFSVINADRWKNLLPETGDLETKVSPYSEMFMYNCRLI